MIEFVGATPAHAEAMAPRLQDADRAEVEALGLTPIEALRFSLDGSFIAHAALLRGEPIAMWGATAESVLGDKAFLWMLGTPEVLRRRKTLLLASRAFVAHVQARYSLLECLTDLRYHRAVRWVRWLGFGLAGTARINGVEFGVFRRG